MLIDSHIHIFDEKYDAKVAEKAIQNLKKDGVNGCGLISIPEHSKMNYKDRIANVLEWCEPEKEFYPIFWINPIADDAIAQVDYAIEAGITGFKIICSDHYPGDPRAMNTYEKIAKEGKSILFHTGILWDGKISSKYNKPIEYEELLFVAGLKFAIAHISWPWIDECIALFGKFQNTRERFGEEGADLYIDTTPGTPRVQREEALNRLFTVGYNLSDRVLFGTDRALGGIDLYDASWAIKDDRIIYKQLGASDEDIDRYFGKNFYEFWRIKK